MANPAKRVCLHCWPGEHQKMSLRPSWLSTLVTPLPHNPAWSLLKSPHGQSCQSDRVLALLVPCTIPTRLHTLKQWFPARKHHSSGLQHTPRIIADSLTWPKHTKHFYCLRARRATPELGGAMCSLGGCAEDRDSPGQCGHWSISLGLRVRDTH